MMTKKAICTYVFLRDNKQCVICGGRQKTAAKQIWPKGMGGTFVADNLMLLCQGCFESRQGRPFPPAIREYVRNLPKERLRTVRNMWRKYVEAHLENK